MCKVFMKIFILITFHPFQPNISPGFLCFLYTRCTWESQPNDLLSKSTDTFPYGMRESRSVGIRSTGKQWFIYVLFSITLFDIKFTFSICFLFSKYATISIYLSAILSSVNILIFQEGCWIVTSVAWRNMNFLVSSNSLICCSIVALLYESICFRLCFT